MLLPLEMNTYPKKGDLFFATSQFQNSMNGMCYSAKTLFLIDAAGACITVLLLSQLLARFESVFGMPGHVLYSLAGIAFCFGVYSISCYIFVKKNAEKFLSVIAAANTLYCILTLVLIVLYINTLTRLGIAYFIGEIIIILMLAWVEFRKSRELT